MGIIDLTLLMEEKQKNPNPCDNCKSGFGDIGQYTDTKTGHLMQESHSCFETCEELKKHYGS